MHNFSLPKSDYLFTTSFLLIIKICAGTEIEVFMEINPYIKLWTAWDVMYYVLNY